MTIFNSERRLTERRRGALARLRAPTAPRKFGTTGNAARDAAEERRYAAATAQHERALVRHRQERVMLENAIAGRAPPRNSNSRNRDARSRILPSMEA